MKKHFLLTLFLGISAALLTAIFSPKVYTNTEKKVGTKFIQTDTTYTEVEGHICRVIKTRTRPFNLISK